MVIELLNPGQVLIDSGMISYIDYSYGCSVTLWNWYRLN